jgi:Na+-transporting NADH:ubiquinone oxidoreductase subunit A
MDKNHEDIKVVSPVSGKIVSVNRGEKRVLTTIVIETDGRQDAELFDQYNKGEVPGLSREAIVRQLLKGGLWPCLRQRPFSRIANPLDKPKAIFIHAMNTEPLAADIDFILEARQEDFQTGLDIVRKLTEGKTHLCVDAKAKTSALTQAQGVEIQRFSGPHPAGNVSTHIHCVDPINKGDIVWYIEAQDVLRIARLFLQGIHSGERVVAITGEGAHKRVYLKTVAGVAVSDLFQGSDLRGKRCISGSILTGRNVGKDGFLGFYDSQATLIPEGGKRELLGWIVPGFSKYSFSRTHVSSFLPRQENSLNTDTNGSPRAIVMNYLYDDYVALDIMTFFLVRAIIMEDVEEALSLGILECDEEDFALCSFACPSKTDVGSYIRQGLNLVENDG